ncbi:hypothetical protein ZWY2020_009592 [Hordeum vulgare]|nr:hypothetical protein ZWY2020_009592 [Hordeum vulgare]
MLHLLPPRADAATPTIHPSIHPSPSCARSHEASPPLHRVTAPRVGTAPRNGTPHDGVSRLLIRILRFIPRIPAPKPGRPPDPPNPPPQNNPPNPRGPTPPPETP